MQKKIQSSELDMTIFEKQKEAEFTWQISLLLLLLKFQRNELNLMHPTNQAYIKLPSKIGLMSYPHPFSCMSYFFLYQTDVWCKILCLLYFEGTVSTLKDNAKIMEFDTTKWQSSQMAIFLHFFCVSSRVKNTCQSGEKNMENHLKMIKRTGNVVHVIKGSIHFTKMSIKMIVFNSVQ